jgi:hypothetical protein
LVYSIHDPTGVAIQKMLRWIRKKVTTHHAIFIIEEYYITAKINTVLVKEPRISMAKCLSLRQPYAKLIVRAGKNN